MKRQFTRLFIALMSLVFVAGLALIPAKTVRAEQDAEIKLGKTVATDLKADNVWWLKYDSKSDNMVRIKSSGSLSVTVSVYEGSKNGTWLGNDSYGAGDMYGNFSFTTFFEKNKTYYIKVNPTNSGPVSVTDTKVTLTDVTDSERVVKFDSSSFPDDVFRSYIEEHFNLRKDGYLTKDEIALAKQINVSYKDITTMKGIEYMTEVEVLTCGGNDITSLEIKNNKKLQSLDCSQNKSMTSLKISNCKALESLNCSNCKLSKLDASGCSKLLTLICEYNPMASLTLGNLPVLMGLKCQSCQLSSLNLGGCKALERFDCSNNQLTSLDVSGCEDLILLYCYKNKISSLKLNRNIEELNCRSNDIKTLDVKDREYLRDLRCESNSFTTLDISGCPFIEAAYYEGELSSVTHLYELTITSFTCRFGVDSNVSVKGSGSNSDRVVEIIKANFPDTNFRNIISNYDKDGDGWLSKLELQTIKDLSVSDQEIEKLTGIEYLTYLEELGCSGNKLTSLDISANTRLTSLSCSNNLLTKLDVSNNKELIFLNCDYNKLTSLNVSKNTKLEGISFYSNSISSIDISNNSQLSTMVCFDNKISKLDISNNPLLVKAYKEGDKRDVSVNGKSVDVYTNRSANSILIIDPSTAIESDKPVTLTLDKKEANVVCGATLTLKATLKNSTSAISWKSSNTKIATVDSKGKITAKMAGKVTITASAAGKTAKCTVTVLYKDVTNSSDFWYAPTNYLTAKGVVKGYANQTEFRPANECTRAQMVTFLYRLQGEPKTKATTCKFGDVKSGDYFYKPVIWAVENGITTGVSATKFEPKKVCTRAQTVTFLWRMAGKPEPAKNAKKFTDVETKDYFYKATLWASGMKILAGYDDGTFKPQGKCLRRQMVTFLYKYDKYVNGKG